MHAVQSLGGSYQVIIFLAALLTILCFSAAMRLMQSVISIPFAMAAFMLMFYQMSFNIFRQILSAVLMLLGSLLIIKGMTHDGGSPSWSAKDTERITCGIAVVILAVLLHSSSLLWTLFIVIFLLIRRMRPTAGFAGWYFPCSISRTELAVDG